MVFTNSRQMTCAGIWALRLCRNGVVWQSCEVQRLAAGPPA
jgi:hypothetical protein